MASEARLFLFVSFVAVLTFWRVDGYTKQPVGSRLDNYDHPGSQLIHVSDGPNCLYCVFGGGYMQSLIHHNVSEGEGRREFNSICEDALPDVREECRNLTELYFRPLWDKIKSGIDNVTACKQIDCTGDPGHDGSHFFTKPSSKSEQEQKLNWKSELGIESELDQCLLCKAMSTMVNVVFYYLNTTEKSFPSAVEYFCIALSDSYVRQCANMAVAYSKEMLHMMYDHGLDSISICEKLKFCNSTDPLPTPEIYKG